jgi:hypothetical protein
MLNNLESAFLHKVDAAKEQGVLTPNLEFHIIQEGDQSIVASFVQTQAFIIVHSEVLACMYTYFSRSCKTY